MNLVIYKTENKHINICKKVCEYQDKIKNHNISDTTVIFLPRKL